MSSSLKPLRWISSSLRDLKKFPKPVQKQEIELIKNRLKLAELDYLDWKNRNGEARK